MKKSIPAFIIILILAMGLNVYFMITKTHHLKNGNDSLTDKKWYYLNEENKKNTLSSFPCKINISNETFTLFRTTNDLDLSNDVIAIRAHHQELKVYVDSTLIYNFDTSNSRILKKSTGDSWHFIKMKPEYRGKQLKIQFTSHYVSQVGTVNEILKGPMTDIVLSFLKSDIYNVILCVIMLTLTIFLMSFYYMSKKVNGTEKLLYLSTYSILLSIWTFSETDMIEFMLIHPEASIVIGNEALLLLPFPLILLSSENKNKFQMHLVNFSLVLTLINFLVVNFFQISKAHDFAETATSTHLIYLFFIIFAYIMTIQDLRNEKNIMNVLKLVILPLLTLSIVFDLYLYHVGNGGEMNFVYSRTSLVLYLILLGITYIREIFDSISFGIKANLYKDMANRDILTNTYSYFSYSTDIQSLNEKTPIPNVLVMVMDINNLKDFNDRFGHSCGDQYLIRCIDFIQHITKDLGKCYRVGGDEFVVIGIDIPPQTTKSVLAQLKTGYEPFPNDTKNYVSFACGYAYFDKDLDDNIFSTVSRADAVMYMKKLQMKTGAAQRACLEME